MALTNSILVISDERKDIEEFRSKLVLLRNIDTVTDSNLENAIKSCKKYMPDAVIVFVHKKDDGIFDICKGIRKDPVIKIIPILLIFDFFDEEFTLSCFDSGMSDYIILPATDSEILMKVIWNSQRSAIARELEKKEALLCELGAIDKSNEAYTSEFIDKIFTNEINIARKYKYPVVLMSICLDYNADKNKNNTLASVIKKSIRNTDMLGIAGAGKFYIFMPKTEEKGGYSVYKRIKSYFVDEYSISAGLCESKGDMDFESLSSCASNALNEAISRGGNKLIIFNKLENYENKTENENPEITKYKFSRKANSIILPVFEKIKTDIESKYQDNFIIEQFITDTKCFFSIRKPAESIEIALKIIDPGNTDIILDQFSKLAEKTEEKRSIVNITDITEENIVNILKNLLSEFKNLESVNII